MTMTSQIHSYQLPTSKQKSHQPNSLCAFFIMFQALPEGGIGVDDHWLCMLPAALHDACLLQAGCCCGSTKIALVSHGGMLGWCWSVLCYPPGMTNKKLLKMSNSEFSHEKWWFSIDILNYQRVHQKKLLGFTNFGISCSDPGILTNFPVNPTDPCNPTRK